MAGKVEVLSATEQRNASGSCSRRQMLLTGAGVLPVLAASYAAACQEAEFACDSTTGLTPQGVTIRQNLAYVDRTPHPEMTCDNCQQYVPPPGGGQCGGCKVMPGPAHPKAYCKVWVKLS